MGDVKGIDRVLLGEGAPAASARKVRGRTCRPWVEISVHCDCFFIIAVGEGWRGVGAVLARGWRGLVVGWRGLVVGCGDRDCGGVWRGLVVGW